MGRSGATSPLANQKRRSQLGLRVFEEESRRDRKLLVLERRTLDLPDGISRAMLVVLMGRLSFKRPIGIINARC